MMYRPRAPRLYVSMSDMTNSEAIARRLACLAVIVASFALAAPAGASSFSLTPPAIQSVQAAGRNVIPGCVDRAYYTFTQPSGPNRSVLMSVDVQRICLGGENDQVASFARYMTVWPTVDPVTQRRIWTIGSLSLALAGLKGFPSVYFYPCISKPGFC